MHDDESFPTTKLCLLIHIEDAHTTHAAVDLMGTKLALDLLLSHVDLQVGSLTYEVNIRKYRPTHSI